MTKQFPATATVSQMTHNPDDTGWYVEVVHCGDTTLYGPKKSRRDAERFATVKLAELNAA